MVVQNEYRLREEIIRVTRIVANQGLVRSSDGNISIRMIKTDFWLPQAVFIKCPWNRMIL